ncbi:centrosome and spindle pole-associated protein 1-like [Megalops cyprinoides]|uniref:centrosome and spindle pole-associated protein 1-like n=1 Tax=Megalops cyprinoides TaxID=118141 RepID=UPI00186544DF|nr:centrosome and spindle pole-associated protein 1-like [Megalops cyprinoides]
MADDLDSFLAEHKAKVAEDRATLAQDPPYLEIRQTKAYNAYDSASKENIPPSKWSSAQRLHNAQEESAGLSLPLGEDYERKKHRLQQDLRLDYRRYMAQRKDMNAGETGPSQQGPSLPLSERRFGKERLRSERSRDYNPFHRGEGETDKLPLRAPPDPEGHPSPRPPSLLEQPPPRRDAATLTEAGLGVPRGRRHREWRSQRPEAELSHWEGSRAMRGEYNWGREFSEDEEEELAVLDRRRPRPGLDPGHTDRRARRLYHRADRDVPRLWERGLDDYEEYPEMYRYAQRPRNENRVLRERREVEPPAVHEEDYREGNLGTLSATPRPRLPAAVTGRPNEKARPSIGKDEAEFATGLMIGAADSDIVSQRRKEQYRQELQEQMAEQRRNRKREKDLELRVAVTGINDPEKQPDRIRHFGSVGRDSTQLGRGLDALGGDLGGVPREEKPPPERPRVAFQSPLLDYSAALGALSGTAAGGVTPLYEDYHRGAPSTLGEMGVPRLPGVPHPPPSTLSDAYRTPYDDAYFYYATRDPLDPAVAHNGPSPERNSTALLAPPPPVQPHPPAASQRAAAAAAAGSRIGAFPSDREVSQARERIRSYQEALKQQIRDRQEHRRREKEESESLEARLEAEMLTYDPWGRGGGGAPLRDNQGNLISDLNQMHKTNEEAYLNPLSRDKRAAVSNDRNDPPARAADRAPSDRVSGFAYGQTSPFARGNVFSEVPTAQQLQEQDKYKDYLKQQIEEKRRREAEERERLRLEEEREERRLAEQRARILREYEEEQEKRRRKEMEQRAKNEELMRQAEERRKEMERKKKEQEEKEREALRKEYERERQARLQEAVRAPSPPIPALRKRGSQYTPRPPSAESRRSTVTLSEHCMSGSQSPPVPARRNQLRAAAEQHGVISELSALRRQLRSEQRRLGEQLQLQTEREGPDTPLSDRNRERPPVDIFDMARLRIQAPVRRPSSKNAEPFHLQNSHDFRQLKYRGRDSADAGRLSFPDPPSQEPRRVGSLRRGGVDDYFDLSPLRQHARHLRKGSEDTSLRGSLLESESAFIDPSGEAFPVSPEPEPERRTRQLSARERRRMRRAELLSERGGDVERTPAGLHPEQVKGHPGRGGERQEDLSRSSWRTGEGDAPLQQPASPQTPQRHISTETINTDLWIRPSTSDMLKHAGVGPAPLDRQPSQDSLVHGWDGPSTYHG